MIAIALSFAMRSCSGGPVKTTFLPQPHCGLFRQVTETSSSVSTCLFSAPPPVSQSAAVKPNSQGKARGPQWHGFSVIEVVVVFFPPKTNKRPRKTFGRKRFTEKQSRGKPSVRANKSQNYTQLYIIIKTLQMNYNCPKIVTTHLR